MPSEPIAIPSARKRTSPGTRRRAASSDVPNPALAFAGLARQAELVRAGEVSPRELVELHLERIERLDRTLNAFRAVRAERALAEADKAARRRDSGEEAPLLGVPIAVKDSQNVA